MKAPTAMFFAAFLLCACGRGDTYLHDYRSYLSNKRADIATSDQFAHCRGYGCKYVDKISLAEESWQALDAMFQPPPRNPAEERARIAGAIAWFERTAGAITGTEEDVHGTFREFGALQQDCVDESTNTTVYLALLESRGHLNFHKIRKPHMRPPFVGGAAWPHQSAVMTETGSGTPYAVDSWFEDNGEKPHIVPLSQWSKGWRPDTEDSR